MKRHSAPLFGIALAIAGCGGGGTPGAHDMAGGPAVDMSNSSTDDQGGNGPDLAGPAGAISGAPCMKDADCAGIKPACLTKDAQGTVWPGGYCISNCNPQKNDMNGANPSCPGATSTCVGNDTMGICEVNCTDKMGAMPCTRAGYSCFTGCEPTSTSECDPTKKNSCPQDGGVLLPNGIPDGGNPDSGTYTYSGRSCVRLGADAVGNCTNGCDPFRQNCADVMMTMQACYASDDTGEGVCSDVFGGGGDGDACQYLNACDAGLACWSPPGGMGAAACRPYCGGPKNVACTNGKKCADLSMGVKAAVVGACGG